MEEQIIVPGRFAIFKEQVLDWILDRRKKILLGTVFIFSLLFLLYQLSSRWQGKSQADFFKAQSSFHEWITSPQGKNEFFDVLKKTIEKHPELHPKYDGLIAERFLSLGEWSRGSAFAHTMLDRVKRFSPLQASFAAASAHIAEGKCEEALVQAKQLKEHLEQDDSLKESSLVGCGKILYLYNLLRIALLEHRMNPGPKALEAWEELEEKISEHSTAYDREASALLEQNFRYCSVGLKEFIAHKKAMIAKG